MLIDSHVNLHAHQYDEDRDAVIDRARLAGVQLMVTICDKIPSFEAVHAIAMAQDDIWCTVGAHPHEAKDHADLTTERLVELAARPKVIGIGETGLDFHYDLSPRDIQADVFRVHVAAARQTGLPLVVHTREADEMMGDILEEEHARGPFKILMHCYTSGAGLAKRMAALGAWFSVSGIATFKQAQDVRDIIADMPEDRIILETDCPYLAPVPMRGRRNEPAYLPHVLDKLAEIRGWTRAEAEQRTEDAFFALFDRIPSPMTGKLEFTILGSGSSGGVPRADGNWGDCDPGEPKNLRTRCSMLVRRASGDPAQSTTVVIDTAPDFRLQAVRAEVKRVDACLFTHDHADQAHGIDDLRPFFLNQRRRVPTYMDQATSVSLHKRFNYIFESRGGYPAICEARAAPPFGEAWSIDGPSGAIPVTTFDVDHGEIRAVGYRFGGVAYTPDALDIPDESWAALADLDVWIVDALRWTPHPTHAHVAKALDWIARAKPRRAILTNLHIDLDFNALAVKLPPGVEPAYDGMRFEV